MATYKYKAVKQNGEEVSGERKAQNRDQVTSYLHEQGLIVVTIDQKIGLDLISLGQIQIGGTPLNEKLIFVRQLSTMLSAGLPLASALEILVEQTKYSNLKESLTEVYKDVQGGLTLSGSFRRHKVIFNDLQLSLIESGEKSGNLVEVMMQIADDLQQTAKINGRIRGALIYPAVILVAIIVVIIVLVVFMIPAVEGLYADLGGGELPLITRMLVAVSNFFTNPIGLLATFLIIFASVFGFRAYYKTESGRKLVDRFTLSLPIFGEIQGKIQVLQLVRLLQMLIRSGIPIVEALKSTADAMTNIHFKLACLYAAQEVAKGQPIAQPLGKNKVVPLIVLKMIATGEETGSLVKVLGDLTEFYSYQVDEITSNLTKLLEPLILLIVGGLVALLAIAIYLPIYSIATFV